MLFIIVSMSLLQFLFMQITILLLISFTLSIVINKKVLNVIPAPLTVGTIQFFIGSSYVMLLWILRLRPMPSLTATGKKAIRRVGFYHAGGQLLSMISLGAGPVSFTHIVKALEPLFSALVSALIFRKWMHWQVYATLIPVIGGVGVSADDVARKTYFLTTSLTNLSSLLSTKYACLKERSFSWLSFYTAMGSNLAFALRAVMSKAALIGGNMGSHLSSANLFGLVTIYASIMSVPMVIFGDGKLFKQLWTEFGASASASSSQKDLAQAIILSGLFHYLNNEVMYLALSNVHPVTLAVGNTMKRVFIMVASIIVFRNPVSLQAAIGSGIGISGVLLYSLTKQYYEKLDGEKK